MYTNNDFKTLQDIIICDVPGVEQIVLFGSYARGENTDVSDIDLLVVTEREFDRNQKRQIELQLRWDIADKGYDADVIIKSKYTYREESEIPTLSRVINNEGVLIWKRN